MDTEKTKTLHIQPATAGRSVFAKRSKSGFLDSFSAVIQLGGLKLLCRLFQFGPGGLSACKSPDEFLEVTAGSSKLVKLLKQIITQGVQILLRADGLGVTSIILAIVADRDCPEPVFIYPIVTALYREFQRETDFSGALLKFSVERNVTLFGVAQETDQLLNTTTFSARRAPPFLLTPRGGAEM